MLDAKESRTHTLELLLRPWSFSVKIRTVIKLSTDLDNEKTQKAINKIFYSDWILWKNIYMM